MAPPIMVDRMRPSAPDEDGDPPVGADRPFCNKQPHNRLGGSETLAKEPDGKKRGVKKAMFIRTAGTQAINLTGGSTMFPKSS